MLKDQFIKYVRNLWLRLSNVRGVSVLEYVLLFVVVLGATAVSQQFVSRAIFGKWKASSDAVSFGRQYDPTKTVACSYDAQFTQKWYSQECADQIPCLDSDLNCRQARVQTCLSDPRSDLCVDEAPIDGNWCPWSAWSECSVTCGGGKQARTRTCGCPSPVGKGAVCQGPAVEIQQCNAFACPCSPSPGVCNPTNPAALVCGVLNPGAGKDTCGNPCDVQGPPCPCTPTKTACNPGECGNVANGCPGQTIDCGPCPCVPTHLICDPGECGDVPNGCPGQTINCGPCPCVPTKPTCDPGDCGVLPNGCPGGTIDCGLCGCGVCVSSAPPVCGQPNPGFDGCGQACIDPGPACCLWLSAPGSLPPYSQLCQGDDQTSGQVIPVQTVDNCSPGKLCEYKCDPTFIAQGNTCVPARCIQDPNNPINLNNSSICPGAASPVAHTNISLVDHNHCSNSSCEYECDLGFIKSGNQCVFSYCSGTVPLNALACPGTLTGVPPGTNIVPVTPQPGGPGCSSAKCEYLCDPGFVAVGQWCIKAQCIGTVPKYSNICQGANTGLTQDTNIVTVTQCTGTKCEYQCDPGFSPRGDRCAIAQCLDPIPLHSKVCPNADQGLPSDIHLQLVSSCSGAKCEYACEAPVYVYNPSTNSCDLGAGVCAGAVVNFGGGVNLTVPDTQNGGTFRACPVNYQPTNSNYPFLRCANGIWKDPWGTAVDAFDMLNQCAPIPKDCPPFSVDYGGGIINYNLKHTQSISTCPNGFDPTCTGCPYVSCFDGEFYAKGPTPPGQIIRVDPADVPAILISQCKPSVTPLNCPAVTVDFGGGTVVTYNLNHGQCEYNCPQPDFAPNRAGLPAGICCDNGNWAPLSPDFLTSQCHRIIPKKDCPAIDVDFGGTIKTIVVKSGQGDCISSCSDSRLPSGYQPTCTGCPYICCDDGAWVTPKTPADLPTLCAPTFSCLIEPANATICPGDEQGLTSNVNSIVVAACGAAKCEFTCNAAFVKSGNFCNPAPGSCPETTIPVRGQSVTFPATPNQQTASVSCPVGFSGTVSMDCNNGTFSNLVDNCALPTCSAAPVYPNTVITSSTGIGQGDTQTYQCQAPNTSAKVPYTIVCDNAAWLEQLTQQPPPPNGPNCSIQCPVEPNYNNATKTGTGNYQGDTRNYACNPSFIGTPYNLVCDNGAWKEPSGNPPTPLGPNCVPLLCPAEPTYPNASFVGSGYAQGNTRIYSCQSGFSGSPSTLRIFCDNGKWVEEGTKKDPPPPLVCLANSCGKEPNFPNSTFGGSGNAEGATRIYTCDPGFTGTSVTLTCRSNQWVPSTGPICTPIVCQGSPPAHSTLCSGDDQGIPQGTNITAVANCGTPKCEYQCNTGYYPSALPQNDRCLEAQCTGTVPENSAECPEDVLVPPSVDTDITLVPSCGGIPPCEYKCFPGFFQVGQGPSARCVSAQCTNSIPNSILCPGAASPTTNVISQLVQTCTGSACEFTCAPGFSPIGRTCQ